MHERHLPFLETVAEYPVVMRDTYNFFGGWESVVGEIHKNVNLVFRKFT